VSLPTDYEPEPEPAVAYRGEQPYGVPDDLIIAGVLDLDDDEKLGAPVPRRLLPPPAPVGEPGFLRQHPPGPPIRRALPAQTCGPVHAITLKRGWHYLEHD
jgi:2,4'-dihydroxyacetophenone dioxygenase